MRRSPTALALSLSLSLSGCFFPADRGRLLEGRVDALTTENEKLKAELAATHKKQVEAQDALKAALEQLDTAARSTGANMGVKLDAALQDVAMLRGTLEATQHTVAELQAKLSSADRGAPAAPSAPTPAPEPKKEELKKPNDPGEFLALAQSKAKAGDAEVARKLFADFLKRWPREAGVPDAHFGLGTLLLADKLHSEALYEFSKIIQDHPKADVTPDAYLGATDCFVALKMKDEAKLTLKELVKLFPKTDAAKTGKTRLAELEKKSK